MIAQPEKGKTLIAKREEKNHQSESLQKKLQRFAPAAWVERGEIAGILVLIVFNFYLLLPFFNQSDQYNVFSAPLIPALAGLTSFILEYEYGLRFWLLIFFLALPVSLYFFAKEISGRKMAGFMSALAVSLPISFFLPLRVNLGIIGQDGPAMASLGLVPLAALFFLRFLRNGNFWMATVAGVLTTVVALTSPLGLLILFCFCLIIAFSEILLGEGRVKSIRFLVVLVLAVGLSTFWYNPKFLFLTLNSSQGELVRHTFGNLLPPSLFLVPLLSIFGFLIFENRAHLQSIFVALFLVIVFGLLSLSGGSFMAGPRFLPAFGLSLALLFGISTIWIFDFVRFSVWIEKLLAKWQVRQETIALGLMNVIFGACVGLIIANGRNFWQIETSTALGQSAGKSIGLWEIRSLTSTTETVFGYTITILTILILVFLKNKLTLTSDQVKEASI
ncbi:MAG: hypothetical protein Q8Q24_00125 [bacterium]|nr:hypothetical protein [bacterium]